MMTSWSIRQRILRSLTGFLLMLTIMGGLAFHQLREIRHDADTIIKDAAPGALASTHIQMRVLDNYARMHQHMLAQDKTSMARIESAIRTARTAQRESFLAYEKTIFQAQDRAIYDNFKAAILPYWEIQDRLLALSAEQKGAPLQAFLAAELEPAYAKLRSALAVMVERNQTYTVQTLDQMGESISEGMAVILLGIGVIFVICSVAGYSLLRVITRPLQRLVEALDTMRQGDFTARVPVERRDELGQVAEGFNRMADELTGLVGQVQKSGIAFNTSVTQIAATSKEQQATATEIAATTAQIGATSTEISATSRQLVRTMGEVSAVADQSAELAGTGQVGLSRMADTMVHVMDATKGVNAKLAILNEKAGNINQVITTISKVAEQTNLLSLNAAIEAEKAGEHGRGFSVVATEIRRLADQTAVATYDIGQTVKEIQAAVSSSVMGMDRFSDEVRRGMDEMQQVSGQLSQIIQQVQTLAPRVEDVNTGMRAQADGAAQITESLSQLNESAQQTVESLRQSSMAIDDLNQVALSLRGGVSRFKLRA